MVGMAAGRDCQLRRRNPQTSMGKSVSGHLTDCYGEFGQIEPIGRTVTVSCEQGVRVSFFKT